jgi:hypothetical protein
MDTNTNTNIFEQASRQGIRFTSPKGMLTVEDLWNLPLTSTSSRANLDDIAKGLDASLQAVGRTSFVRQEKPKDDSTKLMFDIVLHIINVRLAEADAAAKANAVREKKQKIMAIIERKSDEALSAASIEDLQAMLASL